MCANVIPYVEDTAHIVVRLAIWRMALHCTYLSLHFFKNPHAHHAAAKDAKDTLEGSKVLNNTLQGINISHLRKRKIIFKMPFWEDMLVPWRV